MTTRLFATAPEGWSYNGAANKRPERIPVDPEHRELLTQRSGAAAIDPPFQNGRRLEHHDARNRPLGAGLRVTGDTLTFLEIFRHCSLPHPDCRGNAHRSIGMRA